MRNYVEKILHGRLTNRVCWACWLCMRCVREGEREKDNNFPKKKISNWQIVKASYCNIRIVTSIGALGVTLT